MATGRAMSTARGLAATTHVKFTRRARQHAATRTESTGASLPTGERRLIAGKSEKRASRLPAPALSVVLFDEQNLVTGGNDGRRRSRPIALARDEHRLLDRLDGRLAVEFNEVAGKLARVLDSYRTAHMRDRASGRAAPRRFVTAATRPCCVMASHEPL